LALGLCVCLTLPARADEASPLAEVPSSCPVVVHLRGIERTKERVLATLDSALPPGPQPRALLRDLKDRLDGALTGKLVPRRSLRGLAKDGPLFLALAELPDDPNDLPAAAVLIARVSRYADFRDALLSEDERKHLEKRDGYETTAVGDRPVYFCEKKGYA